MNRVAFSPSQQPSNEYAGIKTTEQIEMEKLAVLCGKYHEAFGGEALVFDDNTLWRDRPDVAADWEAKVYIVLHSNAGDGRTQGTEAFWYGSDSVFSRRLAITMRKELDAYFAANGFPTKRGDYAVREEDFTENVKVSNHGIMHTYIETNFHDNAAMAKFMTSHWNEIAKLIVTVIWNFVGWEIKQTPSLTAKDEKVVTTGKPPYGKYKGYDVVAFSGRNATVNMPIEFKPTSVKKANGEFINTGEAIVTDKEFDLKATTTWDTGVVTVPAGKHIIVIEDSNRPGWIKAHYNGIPGYVDASYFNFR